MYKRQVRGLCNAVLRRVDEHQPDWPGPGVELSVPDWLLDRLVADLGSDDALAALATLGVQGRSLVVAERDDENTWKSFANLPEVHVLSPGELNAYDVLVCDYIVFTRATLPSFSTPAAATPAPVEPAAVVDTDPSGEEEE